MPRGRVANQFRELLGVLGADGARLVGRHDDVGHDEEGAVLGRRDNVVSLVPHALVHVVPGLGNARAGLVGQLRSEKQSLKRNWNISLSLSLLRNLSFSYCLFAIHLDVTHLLTLVKVGALLPPQSNGLFIMYMKE
jgi:hypothetical protein